MESVYFCSWACPFLLVFGPIGPYLGPIRSRSSRDPFSNQEQKPSDDPSYTPSENLSTVGFTSRS